MSKTVLIIPSVFLLFSVLDYGMVMAEGRALFARKGCSHCHGPDGKGYPGSSIIPKLAGLEALYIVSQLMAFKDKKRTSGRSIVMWGIAEQLNEKEMREIAEYLSKVN